MNKDIFILIACEESQTVANAFRSLGYQAYSNDLQECSGGHPEYHLQMDCRKAIKSRKWNAIIIHTPCTYTALCGNRHYYNSLLRQEGIDFMN